MNNPLISIPLRLGKAKSEWIDKKIIQHVPKWQRVILTKFPYKFIKKLFGWEIRITPGSGDYSSFQISYILTITHYKKIVETSIFDIYMSGLQIIIKERKI